MTQHFSSSLACHLSVLRSTLRLIRILHISVISHVFFTISTCRRCAFEKSTRVIQCGKGTWWAVGGGCVFQYMGS